jgi:NRPS condensation-like uncharacterized protein
VPIDGLAQDTLRRRVPFTVIDQTVHVLDTPAEPWSIQLELALGGQLDGGRLRAAVRTAVERHPMTRARRVAPQPGDRTWWWELLPELDVDPVRELDCPDEESLREARTDLFSRSVPLVEAPPFRLWLARHPDGDHLLLNANHAAFDGFGCVRLLQSVARAYAGEPDAAPDVEFDDARDVIGLLTSPDEAVRGRRTRMLAGKLSDLLRPPSKIAREGGTAAPGYGFHHVVLPEEQTAGLDRESGPTVNDLLVAALHLSIESWNRSHGESTGRVSVLVPVNLRPKEWREDVVTNLVLDARVVTTATDRSTPQSLLDAVSRQSEEIKEGGGAALIEVLRDWGQLPIWAKQPLSPALSAAGKFVDTAILSNLGVLKEPPAFGDGGETVDAFFSAPTRMPCGLSVGAVSVGGRLHLSFRFRHPQFGLDAAKQFAAQYVADLERLASD